MKLPNTIIFKGIKFKRPFKSSYREWTRPTRDKSSRDQEGFSRLHLVNGIQSTAQVEHIHHWHNGEGWSASTLSVCFESGTATCSSSGSDCDGRTSNSTDYEFIGGQWIKEGSINQDSFAEAAGY